MLSWDLCLSPHPHCTLGTGTRTGTDLAALLLPEHSGRWVALALALEGDAVAEGDNLVAGPGDKLGGHCGCEDTQGLGHCSASTHGCFRRDPPYHEP